MRTSPCTVLAILSISVWQVIWAQTTEDAFNKGNELYRAGQFQEAAAHYETIVKQGYASAALYFNLGNAYFRLGKLAPAALAYERARRLDPNDPDIEHNLRLVNFRTVDRIEQLPELFIVRWIRELATIVSVQTTATVLLVFWIGFFGSLALILLRIGSFLRFARLSAIVCGILVVPSSGLFLAQLSQIRSHSDAILMDKVVTAKSSPDDQSVDAFVVHEGLKVKLGDTVSDWVKITLADGKVGWIRQSQCERI